MQPEPGPKLLIYSHFFAPSVGGTENIVLSLARGLSEIGNGQAHRQFTITLVTKTSAEDYDDRSLPFRVIRQPSLRQLYRLVRHSDLVHVAGPALPPLILSLAARKPVIVEHHGFQTICPTGQLYMERTGVPCPGHYMAGHHLECLRCRSDKNWLASAKLWAFTFIRRFLCAHAAANVMPTEWLGNVLQLPNSKAIPHGLRSTSSRPPSPMYPPRIIFQGRLVTTKGIRLLLDAALILRTQSYPFELLVIGDGPELATLEKLVRSSAELSSCCRFAGRLDPAGLESAYQSASIVVVPSLGGEVFGLVVAENMLRGLPIVVSDLGAFREVVGDTALTFRTGDAKDLANKIAQLLSDPPLAFKMGQKARRRILRSYSVERMVLEHADLYRQVMNR
jgi:glycosyltransferase involved in cell wall biosynthesis